MKKLILMFIIIFCGVVYAGESNENIIIQDKISQLAYDIVMCESNGKHEGVWGDCCEGCTRNEKNCKAYGWCQYWKKTFNYLKKLKGNPEYKWKSKWHQWELLKWSLEQGHGKNWTCYRKIER